MTEHVLAAGDAAPDFCVESDAGRTMNLSDCLALGEKGVILYFYPKDNTSGCTLEAQGFRDRLKDFAALGYGVVGVSRDSVKSHCGFKEKQGLNFPLLSDKLQQLCDAFGVMKEKMMYGKKCFGVERSTFVIGKDGKIIHALRGVKAKVHVEELLALLGQ